MVYLFGYVSTGTRADGPCSHCAGTDDPWARPLSARALSGRDGAGGWYRGMHELPRMDGGDARRAAHAAPATVGACGGLGRGWIDGGYHRACPGDPGRRHGPWTLASGFPRAARRSARRRCQLIAADSMPGSAALGGPDFVVDPDDASVSGGRRAEGERLDAEVVWPTRPAEARAPRGHPGVYDLARDTGEGASPPPAAPHRPPRPDRYVVWPVYPV